MFTTLAYLLHRLALFSIQFAQEAKASDFDDLGTVVLAGSLLAIEAGIVVALQNGEK